MLITEFQSRDSNQQLFQLSHLDLDWGELHLGQAAGSEPDQRARGQRHGRTLQGRLPGRERVGAAASSRLAPLCRRDLLGAALAGLDGAVDEADPAVGGIELGRFLGEGGRRREEKREE